MLTLRLIRLAGAACGYMLSRSCCIIGAEQIGRVPAALARYRPAWRRRPGAGAFQNRVALPDSCPKPVLAQNPHAFAFSKLLKIRLPKSALGSTSKRNDSERSLDGDLPCFAQLGKSQRFKVSLRGRASDRSARIIFWPLDLSACRSCLERTARRIRR